MTLYRPNVSIKGGMLFPLALFELGMQLRSITTCYSENVYYYMYDSLYLYVIYMHNVIKYNII